MKNSPSSQVQLGVWGRCKPPSPLPSGSKASEALKSLHSTLPEIVKTSTLLGHFFYVLQLNSQKKSLKLRTRSKHFQTIVIRLHSFIKVIKFYYYGGNHFKMNYIVDDYTILMFSLSFIHFMY